MVDLPWPRDREQTVTARMFALMAFSLGALARRGGRNLAIAVGLALVVTMVGSGVILGEGLRRVYRVAQSEAPSLVVGALVAGRPATVPLRWADSVRPILGVRGVRGRVWGYVYLGAAEGNIVVFADERAPGRAAVGPGVARLLGLRRDDRLALSTPTHSAVVRVDDVLPVAGAWVNHDAVLVDEATARALLGLPRDHVTDLAVDVFPPEEAGAVRAQIEVLAPTARIVDRDELARLHELTFDARTGFGGALLVPALIALLVLAWERLSGLSPQERREIAVLKALGWSTRDVLFVRAFESSLVAGAGAMSGIVIAYVHVAVLGAPLIAPMLWGWSSLHPPLEAVAAFDPAILLALAAVVVVPFAGVSVIPAWRAAMLDPEHELR